MTRLSGRDTISNPETHLKLSCQSRKCTWAAAKDTEANCEQHRTLNIIVHFIAQEHSIWWKWTKQRKFTKEDVINFQHLGDNHVLLPMRKFYKWNYYWRVRMRSTQQGMSGELARGRDGSFRTTTPKHQNSVAIRAEVKRHNAGKAQISRLMKLAENVSDPNLRSCLMVSLHCLKGKITGLYNIKSWGSVISWNA